VQHATDGSPFAQVVLQKPNVRLEHIFSNESDIQEILQGQSSAIFGDGELPHRLTVCTTPSGQNFCKLEFNHAIMDGGSSQIVVRDLALAYKKQISQEAAMPFSRFIGNMLENNNAKADLDFWKAQLDGAEPCLFPNLSNGNAEKKMRHFSFDLNVTAQELTRFCGEHGVTVFNVLQTAWALVLKAYTNTDSVVFGQLSSGRDAVIDGIEDAVGTFINMIVSYSRVDNNSSLRRLLQSLQESFSDGLDHPHCSLGDIQNGLGLSDQPLFNTGIDLQRVKHQDFDGQLSFREVSSHDPTEVPPINPI
jgi:hypothetical protein